MIITNKHTVYMHVKAHIHTNFLAFLYLVQSFLNFFRLKPHLHNYNEFKQLYNKAQLHNVPGNRPRVSVH